VINVGFTPSRLERRAAEVSGKGEVICTLRPSRSTNDVHPEGFSALPPTFNLRFENRERGNGMRGTKSILLIGLSLAVGVFGFSCTTEKKVEAPKEEEVTKNLVPSKAEINGPAFFVELNDLKVVTTVNTASKEMVGTPSLKGKIKITNKSKDILDIQAVALEYLDQSGKPIPYKPDEKIVKVYSFWKALQPAGVTEGSLDVTIPMNAIKEKSLDKIEINLVYVPSPLKRETLTLPEKVE
jgi:hypothetical protein